MAPGAPLVPKPSRLGCFCRGSDCRRLCRFRRGAGGTVLGRQRTMLLQGCYGQKQGSTDANSALHSPLNRLGPYQALLTLAVPLAIVEPLKLVALFVVGGGHFIAGVLVMICAYAGSLFITERLFVVLKPKLLTLPWFAFAWRWFVTVRDKLVYWLRRTRTRVRKVDPHFS